MAARVLYPPIVDNYMPAFQAGNVPCQIFFSLSKFNGSTDFTSVHVSVVKQKTGENVVKTTDDIEKQRYRATGIILNVKPIQVLGEENLYYVEITDDDLSSISGSFSGWIPGYIYKVQLRLSAKDFDNSIGQAAWLKNNASYFSEWSTVCIVKATGRIDYEIPLLNIDTREEQGAFNIESQTIYTSVLDLSGHFYREIDPSELIHSYQFILYDSQDNILEDSGDVYINQFSADGDSFNYKVRTKLENGNTYKISFKFTTINQFTGGFYRWDEEVDDRLSFICSEATLGQAPCNVITVDNDENDLLKDISNLHLEEEEGRIAIKLYDPLDEIYSGNLCIRRTDSRSNFQVWDDVYLYVVKAESINALPIYYDYTIESGVWYKYGVQIIDKDGYRGVLDVISKPIMRNFNYSFLLGKDNQQLTLMFDNTMNNFKYQVMDGRVDPLGSKYTNIARNASTYYRTFPINGLISFWMNENYLFCSKDDIYKYNTITKLYEDYNEENDIRQYDYIYERDFREKVLEFLQNGEYKLFKSPTEGNIIVRLIDVNCIPNQTLDRMIYSFSATAYEMDSPTMENYLKYGFYSIAEPASDFFTYETKLGQLSMDFPIGANVIQLIYEKYDSQDRNLGGYTKQIGKIHHIKITFDDKPFRVLNSGGEYVVGNNFNLNGRIFTVYDPVRIYEFDGRLEYSTSDSLILMGDAEGIKTFVHATVDFLYEIRSEEYQEKGIQSKQIKDGIGQIFGECQPNENLFNEIYYKYFINWESNFQKLESLNAIEIESTPGAAFSVQDMADENPETHIVGATGQLRLYNIENLKKLIYLGIQNPVTGNIESVKADVLVNYFYVLTKGSYKKEK